MSPERVPEHHHPRRPHRKSRFSAAAPSSPHHRTPNAQASTHPWHPRFVDGSKSVFAYETRYIVEKSEGQDEPKKEEDSKRRREGYQGKSRR